MRIRFDSKQLRYKTPFGTLTPGEDCTLHIHIPAQLRTTRVELLLCREDYQPLNAIDGTLVRTEGDYQCFRISFRLDSPGLYFYYFRIHAHTGPFRLFRQGDETNMEAGDYWQVSCIGADFATPLWSQGATVYQIFPDRFCKVGSPDLTGKLSPYRVHDSWDEEVCWQPDGDGKVLNNDFFGGNFRGISEKLDYLSDLGVDLIYLNPICMSFSSHRYDTADYRLPDPMLGTEDDFRALCDAAHNRGIRVILDGVFSHTGANSRYFNRDGAFPEPGAFRSKESIYYPWYRFSDWPNRYDSWWGFDTLPTLNKLEPTLLDFFIQGADSVVAHWLGLGCDGFRLDVADELPDEFLRRLRLRVKALKPDALVIGEVWEDASNKIAYGQRRRYFTGGELDGVMNYPLRTAILDYLWGRDDGSGLKSTLLTLLENYPPQALASSLSLLGTHDTPRILTALVDEFEGSLAEMAHRRLEAGSRALALRRLKTAALLQFTLPGSPTVYYGDEAGMEGHRDPFNRRSYPWGQEDKALQSHYRRLGRLRREQKALRLGDIRFFAAEKGRIGFTRAHGGVTLAVCCNRGAEPWAAPKGRLLLGERLEQVSADGVIMGPEGFCIVEVSEHGD